ncbi:MAG: hypothetical protein JXQ29_02270 [Planctomycetes bacterium]|nr:hypothetical protein [Planctomycetota bacterium]
MQTPAEVVDAYFLDNRCMLVEIAATLDRFDRAVQRAGAPPDPLDPRLEKIYESLRMLSEPTATPDRAERILALFSDPVDPQP